MASCICLLDTPPPSPQLYYIRDLAHSWQGAAEGLLTLAQVSRILVSALDLPQQGV
jgi:hypothetical protein